MHKEPELVKCKIISMGYNPENNLFKMKVKIEGIEEEVTFANRGSDWGITNSIPKEIIDNFCREMEGKEKNLHIQIDKTEYTYAVRNKDGQISDDERKRINDNMDQYPIPELEYEEQKRMFEQSQNNQFISEEENGRTVD